jgi:DnaK suppressor protein
MSPKTAAQVLDALHSSRFTELRHMLLARRQDLEAGIRGSLSSVRAQRAGAEQNGVLDASEVSDLGVQEDIELELAQMKRETLSRIDAALDRLNEGRYGRCAECGADIPAARLRALPFAVRCLECEDAREADAARQRMQERGSRFAGGAGLGCD